MRSTKSRTTAAMLDDLDAITPCPPCEPQASIEKQDSHLDIHLYTGLSSASTSAQTSRSASPTADDHLTSIFARTTSTQARPSFEAAARSSNDLGRKERRRSVKALEDGTDGDPARLWRRMLVLQQIYGCYNSARMDAALSSEDASLLIPSKACMDMMNEDMTALPGDVDLAIEQHLQSKP